MVASQIRGLSSRREQEHHHQQQPNHQHRSSNHHQPHNTLSAFSSISRTTRRRTTTTTKQEDDHSSSLIPSSSHRDLKKGMYHSRKREHLGYEYRYHGKKKKSSKKRSKSKKISKKFAEYFYYTGDYGETTTSSPTYMPQPLTTNPPPSMAPTTSAPIEVPTKIPTTMPTVDTTAIDPTTRPTFMVGVGPPATPPTSSPSNVATTTTPTTSSSLVEVFPDPTAIPSSIPKEEPSSMPASMPSSQPDDTTEASLINLIQSRCPFTVFDDSTTSPQRLALDWLLSDNYTTTVLLLDDNEMNEQEYDRIIQRFALTVFWYATGGNTTWMSSERWADPTINECDWPGLTCEFGNVVNMLSLENVGLSGALPIELGLLSDLTFIDLDANGLTGTIPTEIGLLTAVRWLDVDQDNDLSGNIPTEIGLMTALTDLNLSENQKLVGMIPTELANLNNLIWLFLHDTQLTGSIPSNICEGITTARIQCSEVECECCEGPGIPSCTDGDNMTSTAVPSPAPTSIMLPLSTLSPSVQLAGKTPETTGPTIATPTVAPNAASPILLVPTVLKTSDPDGTVPSLSPHPTLSSDPTILMTQHPSSSSSPTVDLEANFSDLIQSKSPFTTFDNVTSAPRLALDWLLSDNYTVTTLLLDNDDNQDRILQRFALTVLWFTMNGPTSWNTSISWLEPTTECNWTGLTCDFDDNVVWIGLEDVGLSGTLPLEMGLFTALNFLDLDGNDLYGTIPTEIGLLTELRWLDLDKENDLSGMIPSELGLLTFLTDLNLSENQNLTGPLPTELANLSNLIWLFLHDTQLSGSIPSNLCETSKLSTASIDCGEIECDCCVGPGIPSCLSMPSSEPSISSNPSSAPSPA